MVCGSVVIGCSVGFSIDFFGFGEIIGDFKVVDNGIIEIFQSSDFVIIGGKFQLKNVIKFIFVSMFKFIVVKEIEWDIVINIEFVIFGFVNKVDDIRISIIFFRNFDVFDFGNVVNFKFDNNVCLFKFFSNFCILSKNFVFVFNGIGGIGFEVEFFNFVWVVEFDINNVIIFFVFFFKIVNGSVCFGFNFFQFFFVLNFIVISFGDIFFIGNVKFINVIFFKFEVIVGGLIIVNNINFDEFIGFFKFKFIGGVVLFCGNFEL